MNCNSSKESGITNILIATDGSVYADAAVECGAWLASRVSAQVTAIYVIDARRLAGHFIEHFSEIISGRENASFTDRVRDYYRSHGKESLARAAAICQRRGVACRTQLETGNVVKILAGASSEADLLVMGLRGEDEEYETGFLGSVSEQIVRKIERPVMLTHLLFKEFRRALLAYDGSDAARRAMEMLARVAVALGLEIDAVQLVEEGAETTALKEVLLYFKDFPVAVSTHYLVGDSHALIVDHLKENKCDLMVMGAYDNRLADSLALGTTTEYLMRNSPVPVLVHH
jgi:nucleotide-binding universal stress UspA family protein